MDTIATVYDYMKRFELSHAFLQTKISNGKLHCDDCKQPFPEIHPMYVVVLDETKEVICHPCSYVRTGFNPHAEAIVQAKEKQNLIEQQKQQRLKEAKEKEEAKQLKEETRNKKQQEQQAKNNSLKLF